MLIHSDSLGGQRSQQLTATTASVGFPMRMQEAANRLKKTVFLSMKELDLFASLCMARLIIWRAIRKRH